MSIFDDKTEGTCETNGQLILPVFKNCDEAVFKASYVVASDIKCNGKITALFDLTVLGNVEASELDVKGRFVCTGKCEIQGTVVVQNDIWVSDIRANSIEVHDQIIAQEIDVGTIKADGNIVVGRILAVEKIAQSGKNILCGETAYGAGKVAASVVITGEPIDLDEGEDAVVSPYLHTSATADLSPEVSVNTGNFHNEIDFALSENWSACLDMLVEFADCESEKEKYKLWKKTLSDVDSLVRNGISGCRNVALLIWITEITYSSYFNKWLVIEMLFTSLNRHFVALVKTDKASIVCSIENYNELLRALDVLSRYGASMDQMVYEVMFELLISNLGLKSKFVNERLKEKGWKAFG